MSRRNRPVPELLDEARAGDRAALARLLSLVERGTDDARAIGRLTYPLSGGGYTVVLARSGRRLEIPPGATILGTLRREGLTVLTSCERGTCGTCETAVLDGVPDHRDAVLSPEEQEDGTAMMICCSGSLTPELVLDL